jgi:hypothetical protein
MGDAGVTGMRKANESYVPMAMEEDEVGTIDVVSIMRIHVGRYEVVGPSMAIAVVEAAIETTPVHHLVVEICRVVVSSGNVGVLPAAGAALVVANELDTDVMVGLPAAIIRVYAHVPGSDIQRHGHGSISADWTVGCNQEGHGSSIIASQLRLKEVVAQFYCLYCLSRLRLCSGESVDSHVEVQVPPVRYRYPV